MRHDHREMHELKERYPRYALFWVILVSLSLAVAVAGFFIMRYMGYRSATATLLSLCFAVVFCWYLGRPLALLALLFILAVYHFFRWALRYDD